MLLLLQHEGGAAQIEDAQPAVLEAAGHLQQTFRETGKFGEGRFSTTRMLLRSLFLHTLYFTRHISVLNQSSTLAAVSVSQLIPR